MPVAVPGAAVSPGKRSCNFTTGPVFTVIVVLGAGMVGLVTSEAVIVRLPAVFNVTPNVPLPFASVAFAGKVAFGSVALIVTVSFVLTTFQKVSTALTVTLKAVPAVCAVGEPLFPVAVPGAAVSPGTSSCN